MAKIPLRAYIKEIENLIERGEIEQAIAHAKNILKTYPKHIETYRMLGKAYLESQRYTQALDILQRVLSVIPDDFISQIGMSIIREDEGSLDQAIWHMERAYEVQPFNPAVQDELRRLYGRRDGLQPPKIRLTRGALVRLYARGELYPQAVAETRMALAEEPNRLDLELLLARLYHLSHQKVEAIDQCFKVLTKLPFCRDALQILTETLPGTNRAGDVPTIQQRLYAMEPYMAFLGPNAAATDQVPEQTVMVERFIWDSSMVEAQAPEWTKSVGVAWEEAEEEALPDWLGALKPADQPAPAVTEQPFIETTNQPTEESEPTESEVMPDFLREAGWTQSDRKADEIIAEQGEQQPDEEEALAPAEIPDWLQSIAPQGVSEGAEEEETGSAWIDSLLAQSGSNGKDAAFPAVPAAPQEFDVETSAEPPSSPDWLAGLADAPPQEAESDTSSTDWMQTAQFGLPEELAETGEAAAETPDWLQSLEPKAEQPEEQAGAVPDWLASIGSETDEAASATEQVPDWLAALETPTADTEKPAEETPEWLQALGTASAEASADVTGEETDWNQAFAAETPQVVEPAVEAPDWLQSLGQEAGNGEETTADMPDFSQQGTTPAETPDWMQALAQENAGEEVPALPVDAFESSTTFDVPEEQQAVEAGEIPEWLQSFQPASEQDEPTEPNFRLNTPEVSETAAELPEELSLAEAQAETTAQSSAPDLDNIDSAMAWLEALAARQGADEATLITPPDQRTEVLPDWLAEQAGETVTESPEAQDTPVMEEPQAVENILAADELANAEPVVSEQPEIEALPEWLSAVEQPEAEMPATTEPVIAEPAAEAPSDMDAAMAWLETLAARQGADEATLTTPADQRTDEVPEWLRDQFDEAQVEETAAPSLEVPVAEQPAALEPQAESEQPAETAALPEWLKELEPQTPEEVVLPSAELSTSEPAIPDLSDADATMAWLEALAARQGADEATLITPPEQRTEIPPDWVTQQVSDTQVAPPVDELPASAEPAEPSTTAEESPIALEGEESTAVPEWLAEIEQPEVEPPISTGAPAAELSDMDAAMAWLEALAAKQGADEATLTTPPELRSETPPEWIRKQTGELKLPEPEPASQPQPEAQVVEPQMEAQFPVEEALAFDASAVEGSEFEVKSDAGTPASEFVQAEPVEAVEPIAEEPIAAAVQEEVPTGSVPDWLASLEEEAEAESFRFEAPIQPPASEISSAWTPEMEIPQPEQKRTATGPLTPPPTQLEELQAALYRGDIDNAVRGYSRLIQNNEHLQEAIRDLRDALYRYPVDISLWQTLGDAFAQNNQLQEALDAYTKAEELLR